MATWTEFETAAPELADVAERLWPGPVALHRGEVPAKGVAVFAVAFLATVRRDGAPRLHPFCPILATGQLLAAIPLTSPKGEDLRRDPRCVIHGLPGPDDDELCIRAVAHEVDDSGPTRTMVRRVVALSGVGGMVKSVAHHPLFTFDLRQVDVATWLDIGQSSTRVVRRRWRVESDHGQGLEQAQ